MKMIQLIRIKLVILSVVVFLPDCQRKKMYPEIFESVSEKYYESGFVKLNDHEQIIYCIWWFEAEINNG